MTTQWNDRNSVPGGENHAGTSHAVGEMRLYVQGLVRNPKRVQFSLQVDGQPVACQLGANSVPLAAGRHRLALGGLLRRRPFGGVVMDVDVRPGEVVNVFYAPPLNKWTAGNIGLVPQQHTGLGLYFVVWTWLGVVLGLSLGFLFSLSALR